MHTVHATTDRRPGPAARATTAHRSTSLALALSGALLAAPLAADERVPVTLSFAGEFGGQPFDCATRFENVGSGDASVAVADYRLYVSRVRLLDAAGNETPLALDEDGRWQGQGVALLDFEDATGHCTNGTAPTNGTISGSAPAGDYTGLAFDIGVPFESNHGDPTLAGSPLNLTALFWNWRGGYRFMRVDLAGVESGAMVDDAVKHGAGHDGVAKGEEASGSTAAAGHGQAHGGGGWALHVGSTGCTAPTPTTAPDACAAPNRVEVVLSDFDPATDTIVIDPAPVLSGVDVSSNTPDTAPGCMSAPDDPECRPVLDALGLGGSGGAQVLVKAR